MKDKKDDPRSWFTDLEGLRRRLKSNFNYEIDDEELMDHILLKLPSTYSEIVTTLSSNDNLTLQKVKQEVTAFFTRKIKNFKEEEKKELALFAGGFKGKCRNCGKIGHKAADC